MWQIEQKIQHFAFFFCNSQSFLHFLISKLHFLYYYTPKLAKINTENEFFDVFSCKNAYFCNSQKNQSFFKNLLTNQNTHAIIIKRCKSGAQNVAEQLSWLEQTVHTRQVVGSSPTSATNGPLVKRLRHGPFTAVTWVRFPYGSPTEKNRLRLRGLFFCLF